MSRAALLLALLALVATVVFGPAGCAPSDVCAELCTAARDRYEGCLEAGGLTWGASVGYESAAEYDDWCETFSWELRELGQADSCGDRLALVEGGECSEYYDAWAVE
ncbi:MAG: hypothetical protein Q8P18_12935 [Pseudomonadota bacterium]|nr:hypothetical protein [Pseudomonadota bacterium]